MKQLILTTLVLFSSVLALAQAPTVLGQWTTIDDSTKKPKAVIEIFEKDGAYFGKIVSLHLKPEEDQNPKCKKCPGDLKDTPVIGLEILKNLKSASATEWKEGNILDPESGKTYSCKMELIENGQKLKVRGFLGMALLGRTQVWERR